MKGCKMKYSKIKAGKVENMRSVKWDKADAECPVLAWDGEAWDRIGTMTIVKDRPKGIYYPKVVVCYDIELVDGTDISEGAWAMGGWGYCRERSQTAAEAKRAALKKAFDYANGWGE